MPGIETAAATSMAKAPSLSLIGPIATSVVIDTSSGTVILCRPATACIAPMKGKAEHPSAHGLSGQHLVDQQRRAFGRTPCAATMQR